MKLMISTVLILLLIFGFAIGYQAYLSVTMEKYIASVEEMDYAIDQNNYEKAKEEYIKLKNDWLKSERFLTVSIEHNEVDSIMEQLAELDSYFTKDIYEDYFQTSFKLKLYFRHLIEKNKLNLDTIL